MEIEVTFKVRAVEGISYEELEAAVDENLDDFLSNMEYGGYYEVQDISTKVIKD